MKKIFSFISLFLFLGFSLYAQVPLNITLISDNENDSNSFFEEGVKTEISTLLSNRYDITFNTLRADDSSPASIQEAIDQAYLDESTIVIGLGVSTGIQIARMPTHPKPTIITIILDNELQQIPITDEGTSGISNLTYIQSPFNIGRDFQTLYEIIPFKKVAIIHNETLNEADFNAFFNKVLAFSGASFEPISLEMDVEDMLSKIPPETDAAYVLPILGEIPNAEIQKLFLELAHKGLPTFSLLSSPLIELGTYAAYETDGNLQRIPRRIALNVMKILDGQQAADLPVKMDNFTENLIFNMKTVKICGLYPSWETLAKGILYNVTTPDETDRKITLLSAISEGLQNNLGVQIADKEVQIADKEIGIARSKYLPQLDASATALTLDENTVQTSFGTRGYFNLNATANLSQLILSEPALANVAIQKMLKEGKKEALKQNQLDIILDVANAYLGILQSLTLVELRNENVSVTRKNYDIAQAKEQVGYAGTSDVFRWQSELALDNVDLNTAQAQYRQARFNLNALLNRSIKEEFEITDLELSDSILLVMDSRLFPLINNPGDLEVFADFLVKEAFNNLPEIKQLDYNIAAQERSLLSQKRAFYLPSLALSGQFDYPIENTGFPDNVMPLDLGPTYNIALGLQIPIFQGNSRRIQKEQTQVGIFQLQDNIQNLKNNLELQVRANLEIAGASFSNLGLSIEAANAAEKNFEIAQNSYQQGLLNITSLIDAQNAYLAAKINATNAEYTFMSDFLAVERAIGYYHFLASPQEQEAYFERFKAFILETDKD